MRILIDTNVILDVILQREPFYDDSKQILIACQQELLQGTITTQSVADIYYILRKDFSSTERRRILLGSLAQEDYQTAISFIEYLVAMRKKKDAEKSLGLLANIQATFAKDKGWESESAMLADMAQFRRERMCL